MSIVSPYIRQAIIGNTVISDDLSVWNGEPAVFTRQPVPTDAEGIMIVIPESLAVTDQDFLTSEMPVITQDVLVYGDKGAPGSSEDQTRTVEAIGQALRTMFHRKRFALGNTPFHVVDIRVSGPGSAPTDDDSTIGRMVTLTMRIQ